MVALREIFFEIFNNHYNYENKEDRIRLQKIAYILSNMGIYVGDYSFSLNKYGPYSLALDIDSQKEYADRLVQFSTVAHKGFDKIKELIEARTQDVYNDVLWLECLATLHYLKHISRLPENDLLNRLEIEKPELKNKEENKKALKQIESINLIY